jgi:hypothetical protein
MHIFTYCIHAAFSHSLGRGVVQVAVGAEEDTTGSANSSPGTACAAVTWYAKSAYTVLGLPAWAALHPVSCAAGGLRDKLYTGSAGTTCTWIVRSKLLTAQTRAPVNVALMAMMWMPVLMFAACCVWQITAPLAINCTPPGGRFSARKRNQVIVCGTAQCMVVYFDCQSSKSCMHHCTLRWHACIYMYIYLYICMFLLPCWSTGSLIINIGSRCTIEKQSSAYACRLHSRGPARPCKSSACCLNVIIIQSITRCWPAAQRDAHLWSTHTLTGTLQIYPSGW